MALGHVEPESERAVKGRQFEVARPQQGAELAAAGIGEVVRGERSDGVDLDAVDG